jgi:signal peptidase I
MNIVQRLHRWSGTVRRAPVQVLLAAFVGLAAGRNLAPTVSFVDGISMAPTIPADSRISSGPITRPLERGDIVLLMDPQGEHVVKRVVGLPGEVLEFRRGYIFINGRLLREPYLPRYTFTFLPGDEAPRVCLAQNEFFVLGDNRWFSLDSRKYGPVDRRQILMMVSGQEHRANAWVDDFQVAANNPRWIEARGR